MCHKTLRLFVATACLISSASLNAQLTLEQCRTLAEQNHPLIRRNEWIRQTEAVTLDNIARDRLPRIVLSAKSTFQSDVPTLPSAFRSVVGATDGSALRGMARDQYQLAVNIEQDLYDGGNMAARREEARASAEAERQRVTVELHALRGRVDQLFFGLLLLDEQAEIHRLHHVLLTDHLRKAESLLQRGVVSESEVLMLRAERLAVGSAERAVRMRREGLSRVLSHFVGKTMSDPLVLVKPPAPANDIALSEAPEERLLLLRKNVVEARRSLLRAARRPRIGIFAQGWYGYPGLNLFDDMLSRSWSLNGMVGFKLTWNLSSLYNHRSAQARLDVSLRETDIERECFRFEREGRRLREQSEVEERRRRLADDEEIIALRREVRKHTERKMERGVVDLNALVQDLTLEHRALAERALHEIEYLSAIYQLRHTCSHE